MHIHIQRDSNLVITHKKELESPNVTLTRVLHEASEDIRTVSTLPTKTSKLMRLPIITRCDVSQTS